MSKVSSDRLGLGFAHCEGNVAASLAGGKFPPAMILIVPPRKVSSISSPARIIVMQSSQSWLLVR